MCENSNGQEKVYVNLDHVVTKGITMSGIPGKNTRLGVAFIFKNLRLGVKLIKLENYFYV